MTIVKPLTFMNESGGPVAGVSGFYRLGPEQLVVVHDELDLPFGTVRLKLGGGDNGHNGLRSVTAALGTRDYYRARIGIGRPPGRMDPAAFVLRDFSAAERKELPLVLEPRRGRGGDPARRRPRRRPEDAFSRRASRPVRSESPIRQRVGSPPEMPYPGVALPGLQMEPLFMTSDDDRLAAELAERAGTLLLGLRADGGDPGELRKAGDRLSHEFLAAELAALQAGRRGPVRGGARRPGAAVGRPGLDRGPAGRHQGVRRAWADRLGGPRRAVGEAVS